MDNAGKYAPSMTVVGRDIAPDFQIQTGSGRQLMETHAMSGKGYQGCNPGGYDRHFAVSSDQRMAENVGRHMYKLTSMIVQAWGGP